MTVQLKVPDMACSACAETITKAIEALDATAQVEADLSTKIVKVNSPQPSSAIKQAIVAAGYSIG